MKKTTKIVLAVVAVVGIAVAYYAYKEYNRKQKDQSEEKADVVIKATDLMTAFNDDETKANAAYLDKGIMVSGVVKSVDKDATGAYTIMLESGSDMGNVSCLMDERHNNDAASVAVGSTITIQGVCTGLLMDVVLNRCVIKK